MPVSSEYADIELCLCCTLVTANGECCDSDEHGGDGKQPLSLIEDGDHVALNCGEECDHGFCMSQCDGCGSWLAGDRHPAVLFFK